MARILVIDDDELIAYALKRACVRQGHEVMVMASLGEAAHMNPDIFDVVFLDISLPDGNGLVLLPTLLAAEGHPEIIVITGHDNRLWIEQALTAGAWDYIRKDDSLDTILAALEQALLYHQKRCEKGRGSVGEASYILKRDTLVGSSAAISRCIEVAATCASSDICVLLTGETGTGKEVFARTIHENSARKAGPFVVVDCAALPGSLAESLLFGHVRGAFTGAATRESGLIFEADKGTLFLDEVGELPLSLQKVFLRVLQEKRLRPVGSTQEIACDFRLIAATNRNIEAMVEDATFRTDLFYRLQAAHVVLPPLRERREDILPLAIHFCNHFSQLYALPHKHIAPSTEAVLVQYDWPGNVRELCGAMEHAVITAGGDGGVFPQYLPTRLRIHAAQQRMVGSNNFVEPGALRTSGGVDASGAFGGSAPSEKFQVLQTPGVDPVATVPLGNLENMPSYAEFKEQVWFVEEGRYLAHVLAQTGGDIVRTCQIADLSRSRLYSLLKRHRLTRILGHAD